ncbi:MAG: HK97 family phage prohead protease [Bacteroidales bacterium]|nr:HK97 family phage prohead protease [Bacteroidales bacterium]
MRKHSNEELVTRSYLAEFRAVEDEPGVIVGTPIVFNQDTVIRDWAGEFIERIDPKALATTDMKDVRLFVNHDMSKIALARSKNGNGTMSFTVDATGVNMRAILDIDNNAEARALYSAVQRGDLDGMSFGFRVRGQEWSNLDSERPTRTITDISIIHEVSAVNFPAYPQTSISARSTEETDYSPLAEARAKRTEETASDVLEMERLKNSYIMRTI